MNFSENVDVLCKKDVGMQLIRYVTCFNANHKKFNGDEIEKVMLGLH